MRKLKTELQTLLLNMLSTLTNNSSGKVLNGEKSQVTKIIIKLRLLEGSIRSIKRGRDHLETSWSRVFSFWRGSRIPSFSCSPKTETLG